MDRTYCSLLIVDDDEFSRDLLSRRLSKEGYTVATAENGKKALTLLEHETFDLILLDIMMPEIDGIETLQRIRSSPVLREIPVMMVTALNSRNDVCQCIELGANDYISKPFDMLLVKSRVWRCLEGGSYCEIRPGKIAEEPQSNVLIVDDNAVNLDILSRRITKSRHRCYNARDGKQAIELLREHSIDLVLLDVVMPEMDGISVLKAMKSDPDLQDIAVIMVSANTENETIHTCLKLGADDYISKPFNATILKSRMTPLLKIKKKADMERLAREKLVALSTFGAQFR